MPALEASDLSAVAWVNRTTTGLTRAVGQGDAQTVTSGWEIGVLPFNQGLGNRAYTMVVQGGSNFVIESNSPLTVGQWYMIAAVYSGGTWTQYVNGVAQTATMTHTPSTASGIWLGEGTSGTLASDADMSYVQVYNYALTALDVLRLYNGI